MDNNNTEKNQTGLNLGGNNVEQPPTGVTQPQQLQQQWQQPQQQQAQQQQPQWQQPQQQQAQQQQPQWQQPQQQQAQWQQPQTEANSLLKASKIACLGAVILVVTQIISIIYQTMNFDEFVMTELLKIEADIPYDTFKSIMMTSFVIGALIGIAIVTLLGYFAWKIRRAKGKGIMITLLVIAGALLLFSIIGLFMSSGIEVVFATGAIIGYGALVAGAVLGLSAPQSEFQYNKLPR